MSGNDKFNQLKEIIDSGQIVTTKWYSRHFSKHPDESKKVLFDFWKENKDAYHATFVITGLKKENQQYTIELIDKDHLDDSIESFDPIYSAQIYSCSNHVPTPRAIHEVNSKQAQELLNRIMRQEATLDCLQNGIKHDGVKIDFTKKIHRSFLHKRDQEKTDNQSIMEKDDDKIIKNEVIEDDDANDDNMSIDNLMDSPKEHLNNKRYGFKEINEDNIDSLKKIRICDENEENEKNVQRTYINEQGVELANKDVPEQQELIGPKKDNQIKEMNDKDVKSNPKIKKKKSIKKSSKQDSILNYFNKN